MTDSVTPAGESAEVLTDRQSAIIAAYTGVLCGPFAAFHEYAEQAMGRPVWTHEFATREMADALKEAAKPDFLSICAPRTGSDPQVGGAK